jgi:hypothetical protein
MKMNVKTAAVFIIPLMIMCSCKKEIAKKTPSVFHVQSVVGDVLVKRSGSEVKAVKGLTLNGSDTIVTEKMAMVDILFGTEGVIRINELSSLIISSVQSDEQTLNATLNLEKGKVFASISKMKKNSSMSVRTPTAVAAVRGTSFRVSSSETGSSVDVLSGKIQLNPVVDNQIIETVSTVVEKDKSASITTAQAKEMSESKKEISVSAILASVKEEIKTEVTGISIAKNADVNIKEELNSLGITSTEIETVQEIPFSAAVPEIEPSAAPVKEEPSAQPDTSKQDEQKALRDKAKRDKSEKARIEKEQKDQAEKDRIEGERLAREKAEAEVKAKEQAAKEKAAKEKEQKESRVKNIPNM